MRDRVREVAADVFGLSVAEIPPDASNENLPDWDSLRHLELVLAVETEFGVHVSSEAIPTLLSLEAIEDYLREQGVAAPA
jgi:acyl carrier protein